MGEILKNMKYIVYLTLCIPNNKIYIGVHETVDPNVFDGYIGNGVNIFRPSSYKKSKTPFHYAVNKYGIDAFKRTTLAIFDDAQSAFDLEKTLVSDQFLKRSDTYNVKLGGEGGCAEDRKVKVYMYDLSGNFIKEFESAWDCNRFFDENAVNGSAVLKAIRLGQILHDYQFSNEKVPYMKNYEPKLGSHKNKRKVGKFDDKGVLLETWESVLSCRKSGYQNVNKALRTGCKCKNFYFKYLDKD